MEEIFIEQRNHDKVFELYQMPFSYKFSKEEVAFLFDYLNKRRYQYKARYCFYKGISSKGCQIEFVIDTMANSQRKSGVENMWEVICERDLCDLELQEMAENWGTNKKRFVKWMYKDVDFLIDEDLKYNIDTPKKFIDECVKRGYVNKKSDHYRFVG